MELTSALEDKCREFARNPSYTHAAVYHTGDDYPYNWGIVPAKSFNDAVDYRADLTADGFAPSEGKIVNLLPYWGDTKT